MAWGFLFDFSVLYALQKGTKMKASISFIGNLCYDARDKFVYDEFGKEISIQRFRDEAVVYFSKDKPKDKILRQKTMKIQKRVKFARHFSHFA